MTSSRMMKSSMYRVDAGLAPHYAGCTSIRVNWGSGVWAVTTTQSLRYATLRPQSQNALDALDGQCKVDICIAWVVR